ncbi:hypothetical protein Amet_3929 [Alkaliphilus metalliredigens QYMF]|uniref:Uncharacterized protein n=1 Tax=Alkaliphilus metalliredigens (strain QYMF) TaxID=293826 RepID=A6TV04_ALKMQ|nr:hypothetical protein [Alkaliphilus metalliredigens]ABR50022.1 hypothetical protein Amet_3929 [Alkaliphilus metalliredigens QYMF]
MICSADFSSISSYDDFENSVWDSEEKEYIFLERCDVREFHHAEFECILRFSVSGAGENMSFELQEVSYELQLDQYTRTDREFLESEDPRLDALADMMDILEEYHRH